MTTETIKKLGQMTLTSGNDVVYTVPALTSAIVKTISVVNKGAGNADVALYQSGHAAGNTILPNITLAAGEFAIYNGVLTMAAADTLEAIGDVDIVVTVEGVEFS